MQTNYIRYQKIPLHWFHLPKGDVTRMILDHLHWKDSHCSFEAVLNILKTGLCQSVNARIWQNVLSEQNDLDLIIRNNTTKTFKPKQKKTKKTQRHFYPSKEAFSSASTSSSLHAFRTAEYRSFHELRIYTSTTLFKSYREINSVTSIIVKMGTTRNYTPPASWPTSQLLSEVFKYSAETQILLSETPVKCVNGGGGGPAKGRWWTVREEGGRGLCGHVFLGLSSPRYASSSKPMPTLCPPALKFFPSMRADRVTFTPAETQNRVSAFVWRRFKTCLTVITVRARTVWKKISRGWFSL